MSTTWEALRPRAPVGAHPLRQLWGAWRSLQRREFGWFLLFGGVIGGLNALTLADGSLIAGHPGLMATETLMPLLCALLLVLWWLPADRSDPLHPQRVWRLAGAAIGASLCTALIVPWLITVFDLPTVMALAYREKGKPEPGWAASFVAEFLSMLMPSGLVFAVIEMAGRQRRSQQALAAVLHEHAALARSALESHLAAMQAQVEPQFLFDVLVDIERLYGAAPGAAGSQTAVAQMERLITYLRVALPRLRESGSTLGAEVDLLASYLDLVQALRGGRPRFHAAVPAGLREAHFHPMLLLPLVQRAVRSAGEPPATIELTAHRQPEGLRLVLTLAAGDLCRSDAELLRLQERLQVLHGGRASLRCEELPVASTADGLAQRGTRFSLTVPR